MTADVPDEPSFVVWGEDGAPRSRLFGDIYFSKQDGLAESRAVFLDGCGLPGTFAGRERFTVGELGFGSGLNIAALLDLWGETAPPDARLSIFSVEAYPLTRDEAARALAVWPQIGEAANALLAQWPSQARGFHRIDLPAYRATLDLAVMEALPALQAWSGAADAWFLDGFSPATNPQMWRDEVLAQIAAKSAPGARLATFTVAGQVRRGLAEQGFAVEKRPGHGRKRERLEGRLAGEAIEPVNLSQVAIIGAGIAGASLARALRGQGVRARVYDTVGPGAGASGNPAALVTPGLDASGGPMARLYAQACQRATTLYGQTPDCVIAKGVVRLPSGERDPGRFEKVAGQDIFPPGGLALVEGGQVEAMTGEASPAGLLLRDSLVVEPARLLAAWLEDAAQVAEVTGLTRLEAGWRLDFADGRAPAQAETVILAAGWDSLALHPSLPLSPVRGQASYVASEERPYPMVFGDYLIPTRDGLLFGATHDRGDAASELRERDTARNLAKLASVRPRAALRLAGADIQNRAAIRAATPDRLPLAGALAAPGLFVLTGLGSRGFTTAPLLAEHVCALVLGIPSPLPADLARKVAPGRYGSEPA